MKQETFLASKDAFKKNILEFPRQLSARNLEIKHAARLSTMRPDGIVISGMGGSGLAGMILLAAKKELGLNVPVVLWKDYGLPASSEIPARRPLFIFVSFSGNTEEVLSGLRELKKRGRHFPAVAITTGGKLKDMAEHQSIPAVIFPAPDLTPRQAIGRMFYSLTEILNHAGLLKRKPPQFKAIKARGCQAQGLTLAKKLKGRLLLIYTAKTDRHIGYIWKIKFNETAKTPAFNNVLPEMNHNELVGFDGAHAKKCVWAAIFLEKRILALRIKKRLNLTKKLLARRGVKAISITLQGKSKLAETWRSIILADWTTYYLAKINNVDPSATPSVDLLKKLMK